MEHIFKTKDKKQAKRLVKADDMASFIWELKNNGWREFKYTDYDYHPAWDKINQMLNDAGIDIDDLWE